MSPNPLLIIVSAVILVIVRFLMRHLKESKEFPRGPPRYPIIGSFLSLPLKQLGSGMVKDVARQAKKYGKMTGFFLGPFYRLVVVNDFTLARKLANDETFATREGGPSQTHARGVGGRATGVIWTNGKQWKSVRKFSVRTLKEFGMGKTTMSNAIVEEALETIERLKHQCDGDLLIEQTFNIAIFNILWKITAGHRYNHDDPFVSGMINDLAKTFGYLAPYNILHPIKNLATAAGWCDFEFVQKFYHSLKSLFHKVIDEHESIYDNEASTQDFIDAYLREMRVNPSEFSERDDLIGICLDFFEAGGESVATSLSWLFMYMALNPEVQDKCYEELIDKLGGRIPSPDDRTFLPYCEATIMEMQRLGNVGPNSIPTMVKEDVYVDGYKLPKGCYIAYNFTGFHLDPDYWTDPKVFRPERFLDGKEKEQFVPFGMGKRRCMGEVLGRMELFLFSILLLQHFKIEAPVDHKRPDPEEDVTGVTRRPRPFYVKLSVRK